MKTEKGWGRWSAACFALFFVVDKKSRSRARSRIYDSRDLLFLPLFMLTDFDLYMLRWGRFFEISWLMERGIINGRSGPRAMVVLFLVSIGLLLSPMVFPFDNLSNWHSTYLYNSHPATARSFHSIPKSGLRTRPLGYWILLRSAGTSQCWTWAE